MNDAKNVPVIRTEKLTRVYAMGESVVTALREADLTVQAGEFIALMGASGSGKSTLLNLIGLLDRATSGEYYLEGRPVSSLRRDELATLRSIVSPFGGVYNLNRKGVQPGSVVYNPSVGRPLTFQSLKDFIHEAHISSRPAYPPAL